MSRPTKVTAIPAVPSQVDPKLKPILTAVKEALEIQVGQRGEALDKAVTFRDLTESGIATFKANANANVIGQTGGGTLLPAGATISDSTVPQNPSNLSAAGAFTNVLLSWNGSFANRAVASVEIFRSATDVLTAATHIGSTPGSIYVDTVDPGSTFYYWVRFVSNSGVIGPFNATDGTVATTNKSVASVLTDLNESIGVSSLDTALAANIATIGTIGTSVTSHTSALGALVGEQYIRINGANEVAGYGIAAGATSSEFTVNAGLFKVGNGLGGSTIPFFIVSGQGMTVAANGTKYTNTPQSYQLANHPSGKWFAAGTYMDTAMIADASIDTAKINNLTVTTANITGTLTSAQIGAGTITADKIGAGAITSNKITLDGNLAFSNAGSGIHFTKTALASTTTGAYFGRGVGAQAGFAGINISSPSAGIYADTTGNVSLNNVNLYAGEAGQALEFITSGYHIANVSALQTNITITLVGAGGGACNNAVGSVLGNHTRASGQDGQNSWVEFWSGPDATGTAIVSFTATGGTGSAHSVGPNNSPAPGQSGQASSQAGSGGASGSAGVANGLPPFNTNMNGSKGGGGGGPGGGYTSGFPYGPVNVQAQAGATVSHASLAVPTFNGARAQSYKCFIGTGGVGGSYTAAATANHAAVFTTPGGNGGNGYLAMTNPNAGGVEIDLVALINRVSVLETNH